METKERKGADGKESMGEVYRREGWLVWEREGKSKGKVKGERGKTVAGARELAAVMAEERDGSHGEDEGHGCSIKAAMVES